MRTDRDKCRYLYDNNSLKNTFFPEFLTLTNRYLNSSRKMFDILCNIKDYSKGGAAEGSDVVCP